MKLQMTKPQRGRPGGIIVYIALLYVNLFIGHTFLAPSELMISKCRLVC